jgi:hypothetical protein
MFAGHSKRMSDNGKTNTPVISEDTGYYVYCVARRSAASSIVDAKTPVAIEDTASVELISRNDLAAVLSEVPLAQYGEESLAERLTDASWTAIRAMRHEQVVEFFAKRTSVVPLRFGTIYLDKARVEEMLTSQQPQLETILDRLDGCEEWGVNVYSDRKVLLDNIANVSPRLRQMADEAVKTTAGQSYLMKKKIEALKADEAKVEVARATEEIENRLREESRDATRLRILKVETTEHGELKAKFAFLVVTSNFDGFRDAAEELAKDFQPAGIRIELTGPWPAYNFATA